jgi:hypothetical protein
LTYPVAVSSFLAISRWLIVASIAALQKTPCFVSCHDPVEKRPVFVSTIDQVTASARGLLQCAWSTVLRNMRCVQVMRQNFLWQVTRLISAAAVATVGERLARSNVATSRILSSVPTALGQLACSTSSKLSLTCAKCLCRFNTALHRTLGSPNVFDMTWYLRYKVTTLREGTLCSLEGPRHGVLETDVSNSLMMT